MVSATIEKRLVDLIEARGGRAVVNDLFSLFEASYQEPLDVGEQGYWDLVNYLLTRTEAFEVKHRDDIEVWLKRSEITLQNSMPAIPKVKDDSVVIPHQAIRNVHLHEPLPALMCGLCGFLSSNPVFLGCGHFFCKACLRDPPYADTQMSARTCVSCWRTTHVQLSLALEDSESPEMSSLKKAMWKLIGGTPMRCHRRDVCSWTGPISGINDHLKKCPVPVGDQPAATPDGDRNQQLLLLSCNLCLSYGGSLGFFRVYVTFNPQEHLVSVSEMNIEQARKYILPAQRGETVQVFRHSFNEFQGFCFVQNTQQVFGWIPTICLKEGKETMKVFFDRLGAMDFNLGATEGTDATKETGFSTTVE
eukprot:Protomagalhaensia_wolfi_Nauph_80__42@NODE_1024_length_1799_cov_11_481818_g773_i0_p1_GENE_NODE_1024_length_1799_cov_11_481818_g773_i0NODE_1024_length_1799_cov_11_481818_g773_i0_p1_ORF_typecomplete_len362_score31_84zfRING_UBOX/PF13445_6/4_4e05zfC3HC4_4/PF15227_6/4_3e05zfC3HC4_4/PF15227_6/8_9e03zfC3HC4_3/PF13920_6/0_00041zfC3HC4_3/PF13920_6/3_7e03zfRING_6/PF14835_6/0_00064zfRING_6/PF14835_6/1_4e03ProkRING_4/PF14447_6/0_00078ProkRING_4/PF14447_6/1e04zfC3HC4/PF00097_25/0_00086zfC3HC4/PF00097_25/3_3e0